MDTSIFNFFSPDYQADPFPFYARMREEGLSRIEPGGFVAISRYADIAAALRNPTVFSSLGFVAAFEPPWVGYNPGGHTMLSMDPPDHTKLRALVNRAFTQPVVDRNAPVVRRLVDAAVGGLVERGEVEFVSEIATPVTAGTVGHFLTLDPALHQRFKAWSDALASITPVPMSPEHEALVHAAIAEMTRTVADLVEERRASPGEDMVSLLATAEVEGQRLSARDLIAFVFLLVVAGLETTIHLLSKGMLQLATRPDLVARLRAQPELIPRFTDEMLRYDPPTHSLFRFVLQDTEVAGRPVSAGSVALLMLGSAGRDQRQYPDPDTFDLDRASMGSLAFGHGPHLCIGQALARLEAHLTFGALLSKFSSFELVESPVRYNHTFTVRGPAALRVRARA